MDWPIVAALCASLTLLSGALVTLWRANNVITRLAFLLREYPLHRHNHDGSITYASGFDGPRTEGGQ